MLNKAAVVDALATLVASEAYVGINVSAVIVGNWHANEPVYDEIIAINEGVR